MSAKKTARKKELTPEDYVGEIVKSLAEVERWSSLRPAEVFRGWLALVDATLAAMPAQLKAVGQTGRFAPDSPETAGVFKEARRRYDHAGQAGWRHIWQGLSRALGLLVASAARGLRSADPLGPDILGHVYMRWANSDPNWRAQYFTPWPVARMMAGLTIPNGEREIYDRIKTALLHLDNVLGQAVLLASLTLPADVGEARRYFFDHVIPAAMPYYEPLAFNEPALGSGILMLSAAGQFPDWVNHLGLVRYTGSDIDLDCVLMARINEKLYGLNGYGLQLHLAAIEAVQAARNPATLVATPADLTKLPEKDGRAAPSFTDLFRHSSCLEAAA